jgi:hypothetical protein
MVKALTNVCGTFKNFMSAIDMFQVVESLPSKCEAKFKPKYHQEKKKILHLPNF